jgi:putative DNA primase/helicase
MPFQYTEEYEEMFGISEREKKFDEALEEYLKQDWRQKEWREEWYIEDLKKNVFQMDKQQIGISLANYLINKFHIKYVDDVIYLYNIKTGLYEDNAEPYLASKIEHILTEVKRPDIVTNHFIEEVLGRIKRMTYIPFYDAQVPPYFIPLKNCIVDIRPCGFGILEYSPFFFFKTKLNTNYKEDAKCPNFDSFIKMISDGEIEEGKLWQIIGYCFYLDNPLQKAFILHGEGGNGKSTLLSVIEALIGSQNVSHLSLQQIETEKFAIGALENKYLNIYADLSDTELKTTGKFKNLTGGDPIEVERKFGGTFHLKTGLKFLFSCNRIPAANDDTDAYYRRWEILTFKFKFDESEDRKKHILKTLTTEEEKSGIFNKSMPFLLQLLRENKLIGEHTTDQKRDLYIRLSDSIQAFVQDMLEYSTGYIIKDELYTGYMKYCDRNHIPVASEKRFFSRIRRFVNTDEQRISIAGERKRVYMGIKWKEPLDNVYL